MKGKVKRKVEEFAEELGYEQLLAVNGGGWFSGRGVVIRRLVVIVGRGRRAFVRGVALATRTKRTQAQAPRGRPPMARLTARQAELRRPPRRKSRAATPPTAPIPG